MKLSAIEVITYDKCTGCYGCLNTCPVHGAIEFKLTDEGFYKPFITDECIHCGYCQEGCPVIEKENDNLKEDLEVYSCWSKDEEILKNSSSGGIFSELAKVYLENDGVVFGAKWQDGEIVHIGITKLEELKELQKSKYLQSKIEYSYIKVKELLKEGKKVLFVGTPCEIASLNLIVKDENLVAVDLICHGIPSYTTYQKYIRENFNLNIKNIIVDFRNKDTGWENYNLTFKDKDKIIIKNNHREDIWFRGFLQNIYLNKPCYNCEFRVIPRVADITLGDFWGVPQELKNPNTTLIPIIIRNIVKNIPFKDFSSSIFPSALSHKGNPCLYNHKLNASKREKFYKDFPNKSFEELHKKYFPFPSFFIKCIFFPRRVLGFLKRKIIKVIKRG